ncbi:MAG: 1-deoxy-D-xylulose-5-phosphate reductoisomerase [Candidatus Ratteibacteria bacterium]|nr:1-deoxy-D-xylulose-5-phosphate reductoisomerase [Candidatus Ratteibacteria bacterium]
MKEIIILGSTGSIGKSTLEVVSELRGQFKVVGLSACENTRLLARQVRKFHPKWVAIADKEKGERFKKNFRGSLDGIFLGSEGVRTLAGKKVDLTVIALVGSAGLLPALEAIESGNDIAISNKEVLVIAGKEVMKQAKKQNVKIFPLDSEHCSIFQVIDNQKKKEIRKVILTASGGPFYNCDKNKFSSIKIRDALSHPTWKMGSKITVDCATLMNKGFEVIAAKWFFDLDWDKIDVIIHPQSIVHSLVEFVDGTVFAVLSDTDMKITIKYILTYPNRIKGSFKTIDLSKIGKLTFSRPDEGKFPALKLARLAGRAGGTKPAVLNASNEIAVKAFLEGRISFPQIWKVCGLIMKRYNLNTAQTIPDVLRADEWARMEASSIIEKL